MNTSVIGILAHVDAGKTTLSEAMLYTTGRIRRLGRVDHRDAFLDTFSLERERGITIFSKQAELSVGALSVTLLDTPGHVDFSAETERTLQVLDCAVLVISAAAGVQSHTVTLWRLLERWGVPVFLFINKMDLAGADREALLAQLRRRLGEGCVDFGLPPDQLREEAAMCDEDALARFLDAGTLSDGELSALMARRKLFPCFFGSALRLEGVDELLEGLEKYAPRPDYPGEFAARVYKISRDPQGTRLTHLKITGGSLKVKTLLRGETASGEVWEEKADQLRVYSGEKYETAAELPAGSVCAVTGLTRTCPGQGLGAASAARPPVLEPVLNYQLLLPQGADVHAALAKLRQLEEDDPQLHIQLMGQIQQEVLQRLILDRFGLEVSFGPGSIVYRETIVRPVEGIGHYEPLRHYAEVHLLLEPGPQGSGLRFASACPEDDLDGHWQRLILTHLMEKPHLGVLTGSPITDMRITLTAGRAHVKHTEGGDFRQATYRAVRQGLMAAESVLLEPWYRFRLEVPAENVGRAMSDLTGMGGDFSAPENDGQAAVLEGSVPVSALGDYWREVTVYTRGLGRLQCAPDGYRPCRDPASVIAAAGYDPERDPDNSPDSIFCAHGAGFPVKWDQVPAHAHLACLPLNRRDPPAPEPAAPRAAVPYPTTQAEEKALQAIFERTYGQTRRRGPDPGEAFRPPPRPQTTVRRTVPDRPLGPEYLLIDGYNIIFAWDELKAVARESLETARYLLMDLLCNYQGYKKCIIILVFDAYKVKGNPGSVEKYRNIHVAYTKEAETADTYIERATYEIARKHRVRVATSDNLEQLIILGHGAVRVSAKDFKAEVEAAEGSIAQLIERNNLGGRQFRQLRHQLKPKGGERP